VAYQNDRHLTTEQLSAYLDDQLSPGEQSDCHAHLSACQQCQARLADLRRTVVLLRTLPQARLPRSFALPTSTIPASERPARQVATVSESGGRITPLRRDQHRGHPILQRSMRTLSTIAAVIGLLLIMSGFLANVHFEGVANPSAAVPASSSSNISSTHNAVTPSGAQRSDQAGGTSLPTKSAAGAGTPAPQQVQTPIESVRSAPSPTVQNQSAHLPAAIDLSTPQGHAGVGVILLVIGILGLIVTGFIRRRSERV
jgi:anti-sigma factor RsiW